MVIHPDSWYLIQGDTLLTIRILVRNLQEDIRLNGMSADEIEIRLHRIIEIIPSSPAEAFS